MHDLIGIFVVALVGSVGHCIGMCGGIVLAYSSRLNGKGAVLYHLSYNFGRILTYIILGLFVGIVGNMFVINPILKSGLFILAGLAMVISGLSLIGKVSFLKSIECSIQKTKWYESTFKHYINTQTPFGIFVLGILNGILPCGFVYAFLFKAASSGSAIDGALVMLFFGLGTIPALLFFGLISNTVLNKDAIRKIFLNIAAVAIMVFGVLMINMGLSAFSGETMMHHSHSMSVDMASDNNSSNNHMNHHMH